jgi:hypothetical protein
MPGLREIFEQSLGDAEVAIAIIDSRVDFSHPCFAGARLTEVMPIWLQARMGPSGASHGTHVASVLFGQPGSPVEGIVPHCSGRIIPVYGEDQSGDLTPCSQLDLARAISLALTEGVQLINISGGELIKPDEIDPYLARAIEDCERQNVVVVAATGNEGCECLHAPASLPKVLAVGAANADGTPMPFSNWDESLASHGVLAPGEGIQGAVPGNGVAGKSGTSFACPIVTGVAALLLSLQKLRGERPNPRAVRDAIVQTAIPCMPEEASECERMLGGRINVPGAYERLFPGAALSPSANGLQMGVPSLANRSPPAPTIDFEGLRAHGEPGYLVNLQDKGRIMANENTHMQPQGTAGVETGAVPQGIETSNVAPQGQMQQPTQPNTVGAAVNQGVPQTVPAGPQPQGVVGGGFVGASAQPGVIGAAVNPGVPQVAQAGIQPQGGAGCGCGGAPAQQGMAPSYYTVVPAQQAGIPVQQAAMPMQAVSGYQHPGLTPAQRTAAMFGGGIQGSAIQTPTAPSVGGVAPSQTNTSIPMPTDFITAQNSQLVYVIGELGYDFITDARRDYFVQEFREMSREEEFINLFEKALGLKGGPTYLPEDTRAMAAFLYNQGFEEDPLNPEINFGKPDSDLARYQRQRSNVDEAGGLVWVLFQENQPLYALRPLHTFAQTVLIGFAQILFNQARPKYVEEGGEAREEGESAPLNPNHVDRVSIAGRIIGEITLYNGQTVPVVDVSLRGLVAWQLDDIIRQLKQKGGIKTQSDQERIENFLERIYYEVRNLGQTPIDRAINYHATNTFEAAEAIVKEAADGYELDSIYADKSPLCRPKSECYDVVMRFFSTTDRLAKPLREYRLTVDVNDVVPIGIGPTRSWNRFA